MLISLYEILGLEVVKFGDVVLAYANSCTPALNLIFDIRNQNNKLPQYREDLHKALAYASSKEHPCYLVHNNITPLYNQEILDRFKFNALEHKATCVLHTHDNYYNSSINQTYKVQKVNTEAMMRDVCHILSIAFEVSLEDINKVFYSEYFLLDDTRHPFFILYNSQNDIISTSMLYLPKNETTAAGHYCWGTLPHYRKKGVMSFLVQEMLNLLKDKGYSRSVAQCYDTSINLALKCGFIAQGKIHYFVNTKTI